MGGTAAYLLDPDEGARRRHEARDRSFALLRRGGRGLARRTHYAAGVARGTVHAARRTAPTRRANDPR